MVYLRKSLALAVTTLILSGLCGQADGKMYLVDGKPMNILYQLSQGVMYGIHDEVDTQEGVNSTVWTALIDADYQFNNNLKLFTQISLTGDFIYSFRDQHDDWEEKGFSRSKQRFDLDDEYWQIVRELHYTWTPGNFLFRAGKQVISWGQTDLFRIMDQINPVDQRRGLQDVEFETTIIPIWLFRADYYPTFESSWLLDPNIQFWFNPNVDFIQDKAIMLGNDVGGIWSPYVEIAPNTVLGAMNLAVHEKNSWSEGQEYGVRLQATIQDALVSLNYFHGWENGYLARVTGTADPTFVDKYTIIHLNADATYHRLKFLGGTFSDELSFMRKLTRYTPILRLEALYAFDSTFLNAAGQFVKHDELRWAVGLDWKFAIPFINPKQGTSISMQLFHRKIIDFDGGSTLTAAGSAVVEDDNWASLLVLSNSYYNDRLTPSIIFGYDITTESYLSKASLSYQFSNSWSFTGGVMFLGGENKGEGYEGFDHKDHIFFKAAYKWG